MPLSSAIAITLGFAAIGVNIILTSLVCHEISVTWSDFDKEIYHSQILHGNIKEGLEKEIVVNRVSRQIVDNSAKKSLRTARQRILKRIRGVSNIDMDDEEESIAKNRKSEAAAAICKCFANNKCPPGPRGPKGKDGSSGLPGRVGIPGVDGISAEDVTHKLTTECVICPIGPIGKPGEIGKIGLMGSIGPPGPSGNPGNHGLHGMPGEVGPPGPEGKIGLPGSEGEEGFPAEVIVPTKGEKGKPGEIGEQGPQGNKGSPGREGTMSIVRGSPGLPGISGRPGANGLPGLAGIPGHNGETICECYVYVGENPPVPTPPVEELPLSIDEAKKGEIRRSPFTETTFAKSKEDKVEQLEEMPSPSQIALEAEGERVFPVKKRKLYNFNQNGLVNITLIKELQKMKKIEPYSTQPPIKTLTASVYKTEKTPIHIQQYAYLNNPAAAFSRKSKTYAAKIFKAEDPYAVEKELASITKSFAIVDKSSHKERKVLLQDAAAKILKKNTISKARRKSVNKKRKSKKSQSHLKRNKRRHPKMKTHQFTFPISIKYNP